MKKMMIYGFLFAGALFALTACSGGTSAAVSTTAAKETAPQTTTAPRSDLKSGGAPEGTAGRLKTQDGYALEDGRTETPLVGGEKEQVFTAVPF